MEELDSSTNPLRSRGKRHSSQSPPSPLTRFFFHARGNDRFSRGVWLVGFFFEFRFLLQEAQVSQKEKKRKSSSSSSESDNPHSSMRKLLPSGLFFPRRKLTRLTVRHSYTTKHRKPKDKYEAIADRLGAIADSEDRKIGSPSKIEQSTVSALRGFGARKVTIGTGTYGAELTNCLQRQGKSEKDRLRQGKLRISISNRIAKAAAAGRFGNTPGEGTDEVAITLADCIALDSTRYKAHRWDGGKLEDNGKSPKPWRVSLQVQNRISGYSDCCTGRTCARTEESARGTYLVSRS